MTSPHAPDRTAAEWKKLFEDRKSRLGNLIRLDGPEVIIAREAALVLDALWHLGFDLSSVQGDTLECMEALLRRSRRDGKDGT